MSRMTKSKAAQIPLSDEQFAAIKSHADDHGITVSELMRDATLRKIGRKDLIGKVKMGRPKKERQE